MLSLIGFLKKPLLKSGGGQPWLGGQYRLRKQSLTQNTRKIKNIGDANHLARSPRCEIVNDLTSLHVALDRRFASPAGLALRISSLSRALAQAAKINGRALNSSEPD